MKKYKKLTYRQKAINRIVRRLKTLKRNGVALRVPATKKAVKEIVNFNMIGKKVTKTNVNELVNSVVDASQLISKEEAKFIKQSLTPEQRKEYNVRKISDVRNLRGDALANFIATLYDNGEMDLYNGVKEAYGY